MFKFLKIIKDSLAKIIELQKEIIVIKTENANLSKALNDRNIYNAIGMPFTENYDKRIQLLMEARKRGYFEDDNYFVPVDGWKDTAYFKHHYSGIASNYGYYEDSDSLHITAIGVKGNFSACRVCIYKKGEWAKLTSDK